MSGTSSAHPGSLDEYVMRHTAWVSDMRTKVEALATEIEVFNSAADVHPRISTELTSNLLDYLDRWRHLDEFVGDVSLGFHEAIAAHGGSGVGVWSFDDDVLARSGQIGYADRDEAREDAEALADEIQAAIEDNQHLIELGMMPPELIELLEQAEGGMYDPAYAVRFVETMGVTGMTDLAGIVWQSYKTDNPDAVLDIVGGGDLPAHIAPLATLLTTAMDTRAHNYGSVRIDPDNEILSDEDRLGEQWVRDFESFAPDPDSDYDVTDQVDAYSVLVRGSDLPADVLRDIGNHQLDEMLTGDRPEELSVMGATNILQAIGDNEDAAFRFASSQFIDGDKPNLDLLLEFDDDSIGPPGQEGLGAAIGDITEGALAPDLPEDPDERERMVERSRELFESAVETVASEGEVHLPGVHDALATGASRHMDVIDRRLNEGWDHDTSITPTEEGQETYDFLRAVIVDDTAAEQLFAGAEEYTIDRIREINSNNLVGDARDNALERLGIVRGSVVGAENDYLVDSSIDRVQRQQQRGEVVDFAVGAWGLAAGTNATIINDAAELNGMSLGGITFPANFDQLEEDVQLSYLNLANTRLDALILMGAAEHPERFSTPIREMSDEQRQELLEWIGSQNYDDSDQNALHGGAAVAATAFPPGG